MTLEVREVASAAGDLSTKEENVFGEVEPAASLSISKTGLTEMKRLQEKTATVCCIYDVYFKNFVVELELSAIVYINGKEGFMSVDPTYNERRDWKADNSKYDIITTEDMTDMARTVGYVMKPEARDNVFWSSLLFGL